MNVGSLFSGIGGIELGFERAEGFKTVWFVEQDKYCQSVLRNHWPEAIIYDDITKIDFGTVPKVDVLTGGFPCQDISLAGNRAGIEGSRSGLWKYYLQAIRILRPRFCLIENVSALINSGLDVVLADLASVGYDAEWHCVSASAVGAPHRRDRVFIIAYSYKSTQSQNSERERTIGSEEWSEVRYIDRTVCEDVSDSECVGCNRGGGNDRENGVCDEGQSFEEVDEQRVEYGLDIGKVCDGMAYSSMFRCLDEQSEKQSSDGGESPLSLSLQGSSEVAYSDCSGQQEQRESEQLHEEQLESQCAGWWRFEPGLGRVAHGVPNRVERIKCLGNAVVPQLAEVFARAIKERFEECELK